ncbi:MAG: MAPEG family protein [Halofilum sp. (in: g-proteobacteria)]|nr:MAPEG family protein [Halofilum sp. (in: g-proteobacteria)]
MSIPVWVLLAFAGWTVLALLASVGVYRWSRILAGQASIREWRADLPQGDERYRRAMRAHANCVENLVVYGAIVVAIVASGVQAAVLDTLALILIVARVCQTLVHVVLEQSEPVAAARFGFFFVQLVCMVAMGAYVALHA